MRMYRSLVFALACMTLTVTLCWADDASDVKAQLADLKKQSAALAKQIEGLEQKIDQQSAARTPESKPEAAPAGNSAASTLVGTGTTTEHGFFERKPGNSLTFYVPGGEFTTYGNLDVSFDVTTKGLGGSLGPDGNPPVGNMGWLPAVSTNLSYVGVRGYQSTMACLNFIYQLETQIDIASTSGTSETNNNESNVVKGGLTSRNSFIGISAPTWGSLMVGKTDAPYKNSTSRFNPFFAMIGDYQVIMANTGGDNRVEFGTRLDHSIWYQSPN